MTIDYHHALVRIVPGIDRVRVLALLDAIAQHGPLAQGLVRTLDLGDGSLPVAPAFFPLFLRGPYWPVGFFVRDPHTMDGCFVHTHLEDGFSGRIGRTGVRAAVAVLGTLRRPTELELLIAAVFPEVTAAERASLLAQAPDLDEVALTLPTLRVLAEADVDPKQNENGPDSGWGLWAAATVPALAGVENEVLAEEFDAAFRRDDFPRAWAALNSPGWTAQEGADAWDRVAAVIPPETRRVFEAKHAAFPCHDGW